MLACVHINSVLDFGNDTRNSLWKIGDSVFSASVQTGSVTFDVYMGEDDVTASDGTA